MAEQRARAACLHRRKPTTLTADFSVTDGVNAVIEAMKAAGPDAASDPRV